MSHWKKIILTPTLVGAIFVLTGCGSQAYDTQTPSSPNSNSAANTNNSSTNNSSSNNGTDNSTTPDSSSNTGYPIFTTDFQVYGNKTISSSNITVANQRQYKTPAISTDNMFRVGLTATSPASISGAGYQIYFNCIKVSVKVGDSTQTAFISTTNSSISTGVCSGATPNPILNFDGQAKTGHGDLTATFTPLTYDNCTTYGSIWGTGCTLNTVYYTHLISLSTTIYVNGVNE